MRRHRPPALERLEDLLELLEVGCVHAHTFAIADLVEVDDQGHVAWLRDALVRQERLQEFRARLKLLRRDVLPRP